ncbi:MAG: ABC transporter ATP-binding protein [Deltaproteobacteria bacterium]|nr:MAG: ABC transporter ATP-binding protein [Deltaproteobacteria bacterium]
MIVFEDVWKTYTKELGSPAHTALKGLSFSLGAGETLGLVGANGAGKSTCIRLLMDFIRPDRGRISLFGMSPRQPDVRRRVGYLPEVANFPPNLTVLDLLRFVARSSGLTKAELDRRAEHWLRLLDLWEVRKRPLRGYSKGMQQRANFVLALVTDPDLLILDEPMSGLDPLGRAKIIALVKELQQAGKTILFCSHILEDVDRLADRILVLHLGEKQFEGLPADFCRQQNAASIVEAFVGLVERGRGDVR